MEQSIPPWAFSASSRPGSAEVATTSENGTGMESRSSMLLGDGDNHGSSQQDLILQEYNRFAEKHGLRPLLFGMLGNLGQDGQADQSDLGSHGSDRRNWFARAFGKPSTAAPRRSSRHSIGSRSESRSRHRRSDSDSDRTTLPQLIQSLQVSQGTKGVKSDVMDTLKSQSLETLVRICGKSYLYLPAEQSTRSLMLPTCFRAAAQYLVQNGPDTRGIFRISGSMRVVNELYDYYCINIDDDEDISATVRAPNLPFHIKCSVHDVASMFKRLLSGLPGGILGYLGLFDALVDILKFDTADNAVDGQTKARLIALAIGSVPEILQRELICAVFGLLSLIGSEAEAEPAVPSPATPGGSITHSEKMGFAALGIIFGPLLVGDHLSSYYLPESSSESSFMPPSAGSQPDPSSPRSKKDERRKSVASDRLPSALDKIFLANDVAQMVISNWQGAVSQMRQIGIMRKESMLQQTNHKRPESLPRALRPTKSDTFAGLNMGAMISQASQGYCSNLRKARSASNNQKQDGSTGQPVSQDGQIQPAVAAKLHNLPSQRPSDMTFEEFAARKKLRSHASNMSITSDSTYSAITPQPVRPLSPPTEEDPFYVPDQKSTSRFAVARLAKQRRLSGGISSFFCDKSGSPTKPSPKIARKAVPSSSDARPTQLRKRSGTISAPWGVSPGPAKAKKVADTGVEQGLNAPDLPMPITPTPTRRQNLDPKLCRSEPAGRVGVGVTPQSKTAALIAKITSTKSQEAPAQKTPTKKPRPADIPYTGGRPGNTIPEKPKALSNAGTSHVLLASSSSSTTKENDMGPTHFGENCTVRSLQKSVEELKHANSPQRPLKQTNPPLTPQRRPATTANKSSEDTRSQSKNPVQTDARVRGPSKPAAEPVLASPLTEIKNDARVHARPLTKTASVAAAARVKATPEASPSKLQGNSPAVKSSVKAMAALFDGTPWSCSSESPSKGQVMTGRLQAGSKGPAATEYTSNAPGLKVARPVTPTRPLSTNLRAAVLDEKIAQKSDAASMRELASEKRRLRLSKSEDRSFRLVRAYTKHVADDDADVAQSVDRKSMADLTRRKYTASQTPLRSARTKPPADPESPLDRHTRAKSVLSTRHSGVPAAQQLTGKLTSMLPALDDKACISKLQQHLESKSTECDSWQARAEAAERRVAELELLLSLSGVSDKSSGTDSYTIRDGEENRQSWAWQDLLPEPTPIERLGEKLDGVVNKPRRNMSAASTVGGEGLLRRKESRKALAKGSAKDAGRGTDVDDGYASESSTATVVVHGRLATERLMPFL